MKQISDERVSKWTDTLAAKRKARLDWKMERDAKEEKIRQEIDKKEAEMQQLNRNQTIERAKQILLERNEKVKFLRSQQLYSDVIEGREIQRIEKEERERKQLEDEVNWHRETMLKLQMEDKKENEKMIRNKQKAKEICEDLRKQKEEVEWIKKMKIAKQKEEDAQLLQQIAFDDMKAAQKAFLDKLERKKKTKEFIKKMHQDTKKKNDDMIYKEKLEAEEREHIIIQRDKLMQARTELEKKNYTIKKETQTMVEACHELEKRSAREIELFLRDQKRANENIKIAQQKKLKEKELQMKSIQESRKEQIKLKAKKEAATKEEELLSALQLVEETKRQNEDEKRKIDEQKRKNITVRKFLDEQIAEKERKKAQERADELSQAKNMKVAFTLEDDKFKELALREIESFRSQGKKPKNIAMLERAKNMKDVTLLPGVEQ